MSASDIKEIKKKLNKNFCKKIIIYTGRIIKEKGIEELVEAIEKIENTNVVLVILGSHNFDTSQTYPFEELMKKKFNELRDKVRFTGYVNHNEIWKYYKIADVAVLPSMWEEPAGLTMIEAITSGVPLITTNSGGISEYVDSRYSILLKRDDNIVENIKLSVDNILTNYKRWNNNVEKARKIVFNCFSEEIYYNNFIKYLNE